MSTRPADQDRIGKVEDAVNTYSRPSDLKITDMRLAIVCSNYDYPIIRIDTNQGLSGYGEVRDGGSATYALFLKTNVTDFVANKPLYQQWYRTLTVY